MTPIKTQCLLFIAFAVSACSAATHYSCPPPTTGDVVYVVEQGWHAEIGVPVEELDNNMAFYRDVFPGARVLMFGYGKKTFFTAPPDTISEYFLGPFPGPAVIHVMGLNVTPLEAYAPEDTFTLRLLQGGAKALSASIWNDLTKDMSGEPIEVARSSNPDGLFYAAQGEYNLLHTCNTWTADVLSATGLPVSGDAVVFSGQIMSQVETIAKNECR